MRDCRHEWMTLSRCSGTLLHSILYSFISCYLDLLSNGPHPMVSDKQLFPLEFGSAWPGVKTSLMYGKSISRLIHGCISSCEVIVCEMLPMCCTLNLCQWFFTDGFSNECLGSLKRAREVTALHQRPGLLSLCYPLPSSLLWGRMRAIKIDGDDEGVVAERIQDTANGHMIVTTKTLLC